MALAPFDLTQVFDSIGRVRNRTSPKGGSFTRRVFTYDSLGRLTNACDSTGSQCQNVVNGSTAVAWSYDSAGNRQQVGTTTAYARGNRIQSSGGTNFVHDSSGNITCRTTGSGCPGSGSGKKYTWDPIGRLRLVQTDGGGFIDSMAYDARGRRVRKTTAVGTELYVYDGGQVVLDVNATDGAVLREYAWFPGGVDRLFALRTGSPADTFAAVLDERNGSVRGLARFKTGAIVKEYAELPWGDAVADTGLAVRYRFAGREYDAESGLYYMRARYYDPSVGRWVSEDPIGIAGGANLFLYASNDPMNFTDPFGLSPFGCLERGDCTPLVLPELIVTACGFGTVLVAGVCDDPLGKGAAWGFRDLPPLGGLMPFIGGGRLPDPTNANKGERRDDGRERTVDPEAAEAECEGTMGMARNMLLSDLGVLVGVGLLRGVGAGTTPVTKVFGESSNMARVGLAATSYALRFRPEPRASDWLPVIGSFMRFGDGLVACLRPDL